MSGAQLFVAPFELKNPPTLEECFTSRDYGAKSASVSACWTERIEKTFRVTWLIVPVCPEEDESERLKLMTQEAAATISAHQR